jgi:hypothetical protein
MISNNLLKKAVAPRYLWGFMIISFSVMMALTAIYDLAHYTAISNESFAKMLKIYCDNLNDYGTHAHNYSMYFNPY